MQLNGYYFVQLRLLCFYFYVFSPARSHNHYRLSPLNTIKKAAGAPHRGGLGGCCGCVSRLLLSVAAECVMDVSEQNI